jgi:hypothetical protein
MKEKADESERLGEYCDDCPGCLGACIHWHIHLLRLVSTSGKYAINPRDAQRDRLAVK